MCEFANNSPCKQTVDVFMQSKTSRDCVLAFVFVVSRYNVDLPLRISDSDLVCYQHSKTKDIKIYFGYNENKCINNEPKKCNNIVCDFHLRVRSSVC